MWAFLRVEPNNCDIYWWKQQNTTILISHAFIRRLFSVFLSAFHKIFHSNVTKVHKFVVWINSKDPDIRNAHKPANKRERVRKQFPGSFIWIVSPSWYLCNIMRRLRWMKTHRWNVFCIQMAIFQVSAGTKQPNGLTVKAEPTKWLKATMVFMRTHKF